MAWPTTCRQRIRGPWSRPRFRPPRGARSPSPGLPAFVNGLASGLLTPCARAAGAVCAVQPAAGRIVAEDRRPQGRLLGGGSTRTTEVDERAGATCPGGSFATGARGRAATCASQNARSGRTSGPRGRAFFPGSRRAQSAATTMGLKGQGVICYVRLAGGASPRLLAPRRRRAAGGAPVAQRVGQRCRPPGGR